MAKVKIIEDNCIACGLCEAIDDEIFMVEDVAKVIIDEVTFEQYDTVNDAIEQCPTQAIEWEN